MRMRSSPTSPYARKVMVCAIELGLEDRIEQVTTDPWDRATDLPHDNPLGKIPTLILDDGTTCFDSRVICEYLDSLSDHRRLFPEGAARWPALRLHAMGDGILDASVARLREIRRKPERRSPTVLERSGIAVHRSLDALEEEAPAWGGEVEIGHIAIGVALGYVDFRFADDRWRQGRPALGSWYEVFSQRDSMQQTVPVAAPG